MSFLLPLKREARWTNKPANHSKYANVTETNNFSYPLPLKPEARGTNKPANPSKYTNITDTNNFVPVATATGGTWDQQASESIQVYKLN